MSAERYRPKVVVAMSGGVDSSVAAALLVEKGYEVVGVTMNLFSLPRELCRSEELRSCCGFRAAEDANRVAARLGIPHYLVDFRKEFEQTVIEDFCREYARGRTPNPCLRCNEHIKFKLLLARARRLGAHYVATGHHARVSWDKLRRRFILKKGRDRNKDQSYFLYPLKQRQLARTLMPVGELTKKEVRALARKWGLPVAEKPESQEICFVPLGDYTAFLGGRLPETLQPGPILDLAGRKLGEHAGICRFTVGQRRGLRLAAARPLYVVSIDARRRELVVGEERALYKRKLMASRINLISTEWLEKPTTVKAKIRYRHAEPEALVVPLRGRRVRVEFARPQRAITPGQSVVFYEKDRVVGGGIIDRALD